MSKTAEHALQALHASAANHLFERLHEWWCRQRELSQIDRTELQRIASELGMTAQDLEDLVQQGPHAADLLGVRMQALGIDRAGVERLAHGLMRDLEKNCALCRDKGGCRKDLELRPDDPVWKEYCPNAVTLESVQRMTAKLRDS